MILHLHCALQGQNNINRKNSLNISSLRIEKENISKFKEELNEQFLKLFYLNKNIFDENGNCKVYPNFKIDLNKNFEFNNNDYLDLIE